MSPRRPPSSPTEPAKKTSVKAAPTAKKAKPRAKKASAESDDDLVSIEDREAKGSSKRHANAREAALEADEVTDDENETSEENLDQEIDREFDSEDSDDSSDDAEGAKTRAARAQLPAHRSAGTGTETLERDLKAISPSDPLRRYFEEIRQHPLLEPQEEFALAVKLKESGDLDAARKLVQANLRLVVKIAFEYRNFYSNVLDLIQEGNIGLMKAVSRFDPTKGARLGYYSSWWIRSYILKYLLDNFRLVKIGTTQAQKKLFYHLLREKERLEAQGLLAGPKLLAERLDVREKDVVEMEQRLSHSGSEVSLDAPVDNGEDSPSFVNFLADPHERADDSLVRSQWLELLQDKLPEFREQLNDRERQLLADRLLAEEPKTLQEVADRYGLTRERARQIEAKVIVKLREFLKPYLQDL